MLPVELFPDGKVWANVGVDDEARDIQISTLENIYKNQPQIVDYQAVDLTKYEYEIYFYEKPFFNVPYLFVTIVMEHKTTPVFEYLRPDGAYWEALRKHYKGSKNLSADAIQTTENYFPPIEVSVNGTTAERKIFPLPLYGHHHPNRSSFQMNGGVCPSRGGDWASYPWGDAGAGWPTNLQEITPLCDGLVIDMKFWANLYVETWNDPSLGTGNAGWSRCWFSR